MASSNASLITAWMTSSVRRGCDGNDGRVGCLHIVRRRGVHRHSGDLLLESVMGIAKEHNITDGAVLTAAGSLETCKFHGVGGTMTHVTEPVEILNLGGIIADGSPHFHVVVSNKARGAFGGHLEDGCKVMGHVELTIAKFSGAPMTRKASPVGANALQKK